VGGLDQGGPQLRVAGPDQPGVGLLLPARRVPRTQPAEPGRLPGKAVEVWAEDGARLGLKPVTRRVWWLKGCRPTSSGRTRYEWLYVYGFARPRTGDVFTVILPRVNVERMADALGAFAAHADPTGAKVLEVAVAAVASTGGDLWVWQDLSRWVC
jgi:hypothetical protein